jgi:DDE superfamily endonuclease
VVSYRVMLDVPRKLTLFVSGLLAARRREIGTRKGTRKLGCYRHALFGLAWFRDKGDIPGLGAGFGLPQSTAYRYLDEVTGVLAARAPRLQEALERALAEGTPYVILDGKVVASDRCQEKTLSRKGREIDLWYSGKAHDFGGNIQALFYPDGIPMWVSDVLPGNVHDLAAARENVLAVLRPFLEVMPCLADCGLSPPLRFGVVTDLCGVSVQAGGSWPGSVPCRKVTVRDGRGTGRWQGRCGMRCWTPSTRWWSGRMSSSGPAGAGRRRKC